MVLIEEIIDNGTSKQEDTIEQEDELSSIQALSAKLELPRNLLPGFPTADEPSSEANAYRQDALGVIKELALLVASSSFKELSVERKAEAIYNVFRLYGTDEWTSSAICTAIDDLTGTLDSTALAIHILSSLRPVFSPTPHPMLNTSTARALPRPAGGPQAQSDFSDTETQLFKKQSAWGIHNVLRWCATVLSPSEVEKRIGLILPPTLILMDDWEPQWRARGVSVLAVWMDKVPAETMRRMGIDKLLFDSLVHTLSLHSSPPLIGVFEVALRMVEYTQAEGEAKAEAYTLIMEKGIIQGWTYAPSGLAGRAVLISIAQDLEKLCGTIGIGVFRWLKASQDLGVGEIYMSLRQTIIPNLLNPLQYTPTPAVLLHYKANIKALICVIECDEWAQSVEKWRGQILAVCSRLWVQLGDGGEEMDAQGDLRDLIQKVLMVIELQTPGIRERLKVIGRIRGKYLTPKTP